MSLAWVSVAALVLAVTLSCTTTINVGILSLALALLVGVGLAGMTPGEVIEGFPVDLLVTLVSAEPDLECVGTAEDVDTVISSTADEKTDVLVLDLELQGRSSIDVLKAVRGAGSKMTIIVFSGHAHPEMIRHTLAAGADAYVPKSGDFDLLLAAIRDRGVRDARAGTEARIGA